MRRIGGRSVLESAETVAVARHLPIGPCLGTSDEDPSAGARAMSEITGTSDAMRTSADRLYWTSSETVDDIADRLGMTRSTLYAAVRPASVGVECLECGEPMVFANRTARTTGRARCPACSATRVLRAADRPAGDGSPEPVPLSGKSAGQRISRPSLPRPWRGADGQVDRQRAAIFGGAAAVGLMMGAAAVGALVRRMD
jgi:hypothetical protein